MENKRKNNNTRSKRRKKASIRKYSFIGMIFIVFISVIALGFGVIYNYEKNNNEISEVEEEKSEEDSEEIEEIAKEEKEFILTAAGDCTLGTDTKFDKSTSLPAMFEVQGKDYKYFFKNVADIFENDNYTLVNLETPFTDATEKADKGGGTVYHFKGPKEYVSILTQSSIEGVTIANNHIRDYGEKGFKDTTSTLEQAGVDFCGEGYKILKDVDGVKIGILGYQAWQDSQKLRENIKKDIDSLKSDGAEIIVPYFHWGIERQSKPTSTQVNLAKFSIDNGADMVLGAHPHVVQSLENYKGKLIVYSLGNFSFGGNSNPSDKRTFIIQTKFKVKQGEQAEYEFKVIPASISSVNNKNDYAPTPMTGEKKDNLLKYLNELSPTLKGKLTDEFITIEDI